MQRCPEKKNADYLRFQPPWRTYEVLRSPMDPEAPFIFTGVFYEELCPYCSFNCRLARRTSRAYFKAFTQKRWGCGCDPGTISALSMSEAARGRSSSTNCSRRLMLARGMFHIGRFPRDESQPSHEVNRTASKDVGDNRLSVGVQTFDDGLPKAVERYHKYGSGDEIAQRLGVETMAASIPQRVDMTNFPTQTVEMEHDPDVLMDIAGPGDVLSPRRSRPPRKAPMGRKLGQWTTTAP